MTTASTNDLKGPKLRAAIVTSTMSGGRGFSGYCTSFHCIHFLRRNVGVIGDASSYSIVGVTGISADDTDCSGDDDDDDDDEEDDDEDEDDEYDDDADDDGAVANKRTGGRKERMAPRSNRRAKGAKASWGSTDCGRMIDWRVNFRTAGR